MDILPIKSIWPDEDRRLGDEVVNLAKIAHLQLPVPEGAIFLPPKEKIGQIIKKLDVDWSGNLEKVELAKKSIIAITTPDHLSKFLRGRKLDGAVLWKGLLQGWFDELLTTGTRLKKDPINSLRPQVVFFTKQIRASGKAYYDSSLKDSVIEVQAGELTPTELNQLDGFVVKLRNGFLLNHQFSWVIDDSIKFVGVKPWDFKLQELTKTEGSLVKVSFKRNLVTKLFLRLNNGFTIENNLDGFLINSEDYPVLEEKRFVLTEAASSFRDLPVIFRLGDYIRELGGGGGGFRLIHDLELLEREVEIFLFGHSKKGLLNCQLALPTVRSAQELVALKRALAAIGVRRGGSMKIWVEMSVPSNILEFEEYLAVGLDGLILNLDALNTWLGGFDPHNSDSIGYIHNTGALLSSFGNFFKLAHRSSVKILATGHLINNDEVLGFLIKNGIFGLGVERTNFEVVANQVFNCEKKLVALKVKE